MKRPIFVATVVLGTIAARDCQAQVGRHLATLESMVAEADYVVKARVVDVLRDAPEGDRVRLAVLLRVSETLKGDRAETLTFVYPTLGSYEVFEGWRDAGREPLWFLVRDPKPGNAARPGVAGGGLGLSKVIRLGPEVPEEKGFIRHPPPVMTMNLTALNEPGAILDAARAAVSAEVKGVKVEQHRLWIPHSVMQRSGTTGDINSLSVPVDRRLEALARRLIKSSREVLRPESDRPAKDDADRRLLDAWNRSTAGLLRAEGAKALRHFKSDENVAILKPLLADPDWSLISGPGDDPPAIQEREYYVRKAALETLRAWGVDVAAPVIRERVPEKADGKAARGTR